eukprot:gene27292-biopygen3125
MGYRRYNGGECYAVRYTDDNLCTYAWRRVCTIKEFVYQNTQKELNFDMWLNLTSVRTNINAVVDHLTCCRDVQFPDLVRDRHVFSFKGGVYFAPTDTYVPYEKMSERGDDVVAAKYFDIDFPCAEEGTEEDWQPLTPYLQSILDFQKMSPDVSWWMYVFIGRLIYEVGELDEWQVLPYLKGAASTGKSTILTRVCREIYDAHDVDVLSNNIEKKFGLSALDKNSSSSAGDQIGHRSRTGRIPERGVWRDRWVDNSGSINRRIVLFEFDHCVTRGDMLLGQKLSREMGCILRRTNRSYLKAVRLYARDNVWLHLPSEFHRAKDELRNMPKSSYVNLTGYISSSSEDQDEEDEVDVVEDEVDVVEDEVEVVEDEVEVVEDEVEVVEDEVEVVENEVESDDEAQAMSESESDDEAQAMSESESDAQAQAQAMSESDDEPEPEPEAQPDIYQPAHTFEDVSGMLRILNAFPWALSRSMQKAALETPGYMRHLLVTRFRSMRKAVRAMQSMGNMKCILALVQDNSDVSPKVARSCMLSEIRAAIHSDRSIEALRCMQEYWKDVINDNLVIECMGLAIRRNRPDIVRSFLITGGPVRLRRNLFDDPFMIACKFGYAEVVQILLDANAIDRTGYADDHYDKAFAHGHITIMHMLFERGLTSFDACTMANMAFSVLFRDKPFEIRQDEEGIMRAAAHVVSG